jgi:hypothetical protein
MPVEPNREEIEAQLMGGEIQEEKVDGLRVVEDAPALKEVEAKEPELVQEDTLEQIRERLAKAEEERSNYQRAMQEEREAKKVSDRTLQSLVERLETIQKEKEVPALKEYTPVYEEDPAAYLKWQNDQILADRRQELADRQQREQQNTQAQQIQQLQQAVKQGINQYAEQTPDYNDAAKFLVESRIKELEIMGIRDRQEQMQTLTQEELQVGSWALQRGVSPGELVYNLAKSRGYQSQTSGSGVSTNKPQVKSLSNISGSPSGNKESLQARAERILSATNLKDTLSINQDELEKILKEAR